MDKYCVCFGHSNIIINEQIKQKTYNEIEKIINSGITVFLFGGLSTFDNCVYDCVTKIKEEQSADIKRIFCFPLEKHIKKTPHWFIDKEYEEKICLPLAYDYWYKSIYYRNCAMIEKSSIILFCVEERQNSGAYKAYKYAKKLKKTIVNVL